MSIESAAGTRGRPGMVMISPQTATTNSAPAESRTSRTSMVWSLGAAPAAHRPVVGHQRLDAERLALVLDQRDLGVGVGGEAIDRDHRRDAELADVLDVALQVGHAAFQRGEIFFLEVLFLHPAMH